MKRASHIERGILESSFGENQFTKGYFEYRGLRTRYYAIVLRISAIGHHRPFGFVVSRDADAEAPDDELFLEQLVGCQDVTLKGATRVGENDQVISEKVYIYNATGKDLGDFDVPPLASFYIDEVHDLVPSKSNENERFAQYFFCAPTSVWPKSSGSVFSLDGDGKFVVDKQIYKYASKTMPIELEISPFSRYPQRPRDQELGPEMFREPFAEDMNLGEHSTKLILNAPQASLVIKTRDIKLSDEEFSSHCANIVSSLQWVFSFLSGARCYWHTRVIQKTECCQITHVYNGDWHSTVEYEPVEYPLDHRNQVSFFEYVVDKSLEGMGFCERIKTPIHAYLSCLPARNLRDRFTLVCLLLEDLSKEHNEWIVPKKEWRAFINDVKDRFPILDDDERIRSDVSHIARLTFAQRLKAWAIANNIEYDDLDKDDPFSDIVKTRNKIVHGLNEEKITDEMVFLQMSKATTVLERYIFRIIDWNGSCRIRPIFERAIHENRLGNAR